MSPRYKAANDAKPSLKVYEEAFPQDYTLRRALGAIKSGGDPSRDLAACASKAAGNESIEEAVATVKSAASA